MKYYVTADVHSYYSLLKAALTKQGFFEDPEPHKLIICGDLFDRGEEALQMQTFILDLMARDQVILVRGNHEDLITGLLDTWAEGNYTRNHHHKNGTIDTICQLTHTSSLWKFYANTEKIGSDMRNVPYIKQIIPAMVDYFETDHYIFVHGWIPCTTVLSDDNRKDYTPIPDWRNADKTQWDKARWINGMEAAHAGILEPGKTIVCGHYNCSFGHSQYNQDGGEFHNSPNFNPYYNDGIIALDACTAKSQQVNCIVIED